MGITIRSKQQQIEPFKGANILVVTGPSTGSTMMTVSDLTVKSNVASAYHCHPKTEESIFVVSGEAEFRVGNHKFQVSAGDCVLAPRGVGHGLKNIGDSDARFVCAYPVPIPDRQEIDEPEFVLSEPKQGVFFRGRAESYEFFPGISRYDMVGNFLGAESTYFSELTFQPGSIAPNHFHPSHEESMFCLEGNLTAVYDKENSIELHSGDIFTCEIGVRHGIFNQSKSLGKLLAIHPVLNPPPRVDVE